MVVFIGVELTVSTLVGRALLANAMSVSLNFTLRGLLHVSSFFVGGFLIGVVSPRLRMWEPAVGAFCAVLLMFLLTAFVPNVFVRFEGGKLMMAGSFALVLALVGARLGEKLTGDLE